LEKIDFGAIRSRGYSFQEEILWRLKCLGAKIDETPVIFANRRQGQSKIDSREAWAALRIIFGLGARHWFSK
jgi:dolichol-phosphate mannosyltransferase